MNNTAKPKVLLVEDCRADISLFLEILDYAGVDCDLTILEDGRDAMVFAIENRGPSLQLAVLDLNLPKHDGLEILGAIHANPAIAETPVLVFSTCITTDVRNRLDTLRGVRYQTKPRELAEYEQVASLVKEILGPPASRGS